MTDFELFIVFWLPAVLCGLTSGATCGLLGNFIVGMRIPFIGICIAHAALAGAVFGALLGATGGWLTLSALIASIITSGLLGICNPKWIKMDDNVIMSVLVSATMGLAFLGIGLFSVLGRSDNDIRSILWGSIAFCGWKEFWMTLTVGILLFLFILLFFKELQTILISKETASASGIRTGVIWGMFLVLTALVFTVSFQSVGGLMVYSLVTNPATAAFQISKGCIKTILISTLFGATSGLGGFVISACWNLPCGAVIVLISSFIVIICTAYRILQSKNICK